MSMKREVFDDEFEKEIKQEFITSATQALHEIEQCFLSLEKNPKDLALVDQIFRGAHTIKGTARAVGFMEVGDFTHELESLLLKLKNKAIDVDAAMVSLLLECNDHLTHWIALLSKDFTAQVESAQLIARIKAAMTGESAASKPATQSAAAPALEQPQESPAIARMSKPERAPVASTVDDSIRVNLKRLDKLLNNVGELVILQSVLNEHKSQITSPLLQKTLAQLFKITKDVQDISVNLRMVSLKQLFQKMQRVVRDTSQELGKSVEFEMSGEDTELDKTVVDYLADPLVHIIRNAVDHGIETPDERGKASKAEPAKIVLSATQKGGRIVIEINDNGRGMDPNRLRAKAIEKGILRSDQAISEKEALRLIFQPGFSTKAEVTDISGRGVGMDVVATNIEYLKGEVQVESRYGHGTTIRLLLPLTLAIVDGMIVQEGNERYVSLMAHVFESLQPRQADVQTVTGRGEILHLRGENLPLFRLGQLLGKRVTGKPAWESIAIVVRTLEKPFAVLVDDIIGQQQVVIKQLGQEIRNMKGISGGAVLGDGKAALILDLTELMMARAGMIAA